MKFVAHLIEQACSFLGRNLALYRNRTGHFDNFLAVCAIFKNEALFIEEWLSFHQRMGVDHFYLYNDGSDDDFESILSPWVKKGLVTIIEWEGRDQRTAYNDCIKKFRMKSKWIAFIDLDEFLFSPLGENLKSVLNKYAGFPAILVYWVLFGSSGHFNRPKSGVVQSYKFCMDLQSALDDAFDHAKGADMSNYVTGWSQDGKSIINPRLVREYNIHAPKSLWSGELLDENGLVPKLKHKGRKDSTLSYSVLRINHYWSKSIQDLTEKIEKGSVCNRKRPKRSLERWLERERELNVAEDTTIIDILSKA